MSTMNEMSNALGIAGSIALAKEELREAAYVLDRIAGLNVEPGLKPIDAGVAYDILLRVGLRLEWLEKQLSGNAVPA